MNFDALTIASWAATLAIALGFLATWRQNTRNRDSASGGLKADIKNIASQLDNLTKVVKEGDRKAEEFRSNYIDTTGRTDERMSTVEREIHELKSK